MIRYQVRAAHAAQRSKRPSQQPLTPLRCVRGSDGKCCTTASPCLEMTPRLRSNRFTRGVDRPLMHHKGIVTMSVNGKVAMVTGAGSGIGRATALALLRRRILGRARRPTRRNPGADRDGGGSGWRPGRWPSPADVSDPASVRALFEANEGGLRPSRPAVQQRRHRSAADSSGRPDRRAVAAGRRRQSDRRVPLHRRPRSG